MKRRVRERQTYEVTPRVLIAALFRESWERHWGGEQEGRAAWAELEHHPGLVGNMTRRPAPFWAYCRDVPDELRGGFDGSCDPRNHEEMIERADALDLARCRWLLGDGAAYQRPGEAAALRRMVERIENPRRFLPS